MFPTVTTMFANNNLEPNENNSSNDLFENDFVGNHFMYHHSKSILKKAAEIICNTLGCAVLLKGGHQLNDANDLLFQKEKEPVWFHGKRIDNPNTHGTGCTLSSAIASNLAKGRDLETSVRYAKNYISGALAAMLDLGKGSGPMNHAFAVEGEYKG